MQVLAVNGFDSDDKPPLVERAVEMLAGRGHGVDRLDLADAGFDAFMTPEEREAYHGDDPLVTPEAAAAADLVRAAAGIVIVYPMVHGTGPARVKSFIERVFVLGVGFEFLPSGRITGALDHMKRACVFGVSDGQPTRARRNDFGPCLARSFYLSSNRSCKARYVGVQNGEPGARQIDAELRGW